MPYKKQTQSFYLVIIQIFILGFYITGFQLSYFWFSYHITNQSRFNKSNPLCIEPILLLLFGDLHKSNQQDFYLILFIFLVHILIPAWHQISYQLDTSLFRRVYLL